MIVVMDDGRELEFPDDMTDEQLIAFAELYNQKGGKSQFTQEGQSAVEPEDVSTAGLETGTWEGQKGMAREFADIPTFGFAEEIEGALRPDATIDDIRAEKQQFQIENPNLATGVNLAGAVAMPVGAIRSGAKKVAPRFFERVQQMTPTKKVMTEAGLGGTAYGVGSGEGGIDDLSDRASKGLEYGALSTITSGLGTKMIEKLRNIKHAKNLALNKDKTIAKYNEDIKQTYAKADLEAPITSSTMDEMEATVRSNVGIIDGKGVQKSDIYIKENLPKTNAFLDDLVSYSKEAGKDGRAITWGELDKLRSQAWEDWATLSRFDSKDARELANAIHNLDNYIEYQFPSKSAFLKEARELWKEKKEIEILDSLFKWAEEGATSSGSGGNVVNKYLQAIDKVIGRSPDGSTKPLARFFSPETLAEMKAFKDSNGGGRFLRSLSKLSPDGNGLMLALNVIGATVDPKTLAITAGAKGAQVFTEGKVRRGAQTLLNRASDRYAPPPPPINTKVPSAIGIATGGQTGENVDTGQGILNLLDLANSTIRR